MRYYVYSPAYSPAVGGIVALHRLADLLAAEGKDCWIVTPHAEKGTRASIHKIAAFSIEECPPEFSVSAKDAMAIYPEGVLGNPLGCEKVTRWILRDTGNETYKDSDFIFRYHERQNLSFANGRSHGLLNIALFPTDLLDTIKRDFRWKIRLMVRKEKRRVMPLSWIVPVVDDLEKKGFEALVGEISKCSIFISYDTKTGYSHIASYLGALSVVIPNKQTSWQEYHSVFSVKYGIAYGWWDVPRAIWTRGKLRKRMRDLPKRNVEQVQNYLRIVEQV